MRLPLDNCNSISAAGTGEGSSLIKPFVEVDLLNRIVVSDNTYASNKIHEPEYYAGDKDLSD
ncbi:MAG: hypothetical protein ABIN89_20930 [Chitinophagaceae bacterium]